MTERFGRCDLLWVNVGVQHFGTVESTPEDVWRWVLDVNVVGAVRAVQAFLPLLRAAEHADSPSPRRPTRSPGRPARRVPGQQVRRRRRGETLRLELADESIGVSVVYPAGMLTRHLESSAAAPPAELGSGGSPRTTSPP